MHHVIKSLVSCCLVIAAGGSALAEEGQWTVLNPSNTGLPGELVHLQRFAPDGTMWVGARWPFWGEGGIGIYDFTTDTWQTYADWDSPLPDHHINDIEFAADGSAWIATLGGLARKDGDVWTVYTTANSGLLHNEIRDVEVAPNGDVWVLNSTSTSPSHALLRFDGAHWETFEVGDELPWELPWVFLEGVEVASNGHVYVTNEVLFGVAEYDGATWTLHGEDVNLFADPHEDADGNLWMTAGVGGGNFFYRFDGTSFATYGPSNTPFADTTILTIAPVPGGDVYIANWFGQIIRTSDGGESWALVANVGDTVYSLSPQPDGELWLSTIGAVRHYDAAGNWVEAFNSYNTGLPWYFVDDLTADSGGNMWVATDEAGVSRFDGERWRNFGAHNAGSEPWPFTPGTSHGAESVGVTYEDQDGNIWIGSNGVARWDEASNTWERWSWDNANLPSDIIESLTQTGDGTMWAGSFYGVFSFDGSDWTQHVFGIGTANEVEDVATDVNGDLWVATFIAVHKYDGTEWQTWDAQNSALPSPGYSAIECDGSGNVWLGTANGLARFDGSSWVTFDSSNTPMPADEVQDIAFRSDGLMAFTTIEFGPVTPFPNGVVLYDGETWTVHTYENSPLPHYQLGALTFDGNGDLWVSAISEGVAVLDLPDVGPLGDINNDGIVGVEDFLALLAAWGPCDGCPEDLDGDGVVGVIDFLTLLANWT